MADGDRDGIEAGFKRAMRQLAGGVAVVAAGTGGRRRGLTATAICSLSPANPPKMLVCVNKSAEAHDVIADAGCFSINFLRHDQQALAERFAALDGSKGVSRFAGDPWNRLVTGAPVLSSAVAALDCELDLEITTETHTVYIGRVIATVCDDVGRPLVYYQRQFCAPHPLELALAAG